MEGLEIAALLFWLVWALLVGLWSRPSARERRVLQRYSRGETVRLLLSHSRRRSTLDHSSQPAFAAWRRRVGLGLAAVALPVFLVGVFWERSEPAPTPAPLAVVTPPPAPPSPADAPPEPALPEAAAESDEPKPKTVTIEDDEALEEKRTQTRLFAAARVRPIYDNDDLLGVRIVGVTEGSFWDDVGVRSGDVILEANGELMDTPEASVRLMDSLANAYEIILRVRGEDGRERMLEYQTPRGR